MPPVAAAVAVGAMTTASVAIAASALTWGAIIMGVAAAGLSLAQSYLFAPDKPSFADQMGGARRAQQLRQPITTRKVVYGKIRQSGPLVFAATTDTDTLLHLVMVISEGQVQRIGTVYFNAIPIFDDQIGNAAFTVNEGEFEGKAVIWNNRVGTTTQIANPALTSAFTEWTSNHRLLGVAYVYVQLTFDAEVYPTGIPNVSVMIKGRLLLDPRDGGTRWSPNPALCIRDYLTNESYGLGVSSSAIDDDTVIQAANTCDEIVPVAEGKEREVTANAAGDYLEADEEVDGPLPFQDGDQVQISSTGTLPGGLAADTDYYVIVLREETKDGAGAARFQLATSYANALAETAINITSAGSGTHTVTKTGEPRYTCNGVIDTARDPYSLINDLATAMGGRVVYIGGKWKIYAAEWIGPTHSFDEHDMRGPVQVVTKIGRRDRFNRIHGVYAAPETFGEPSDYPALISDSFTTQDNGEPAWLDYNLPFTSRSQTAQRLAKIKLLASRQELSVQLPMNLSGTLVEPPNTLELTIDRLGWAEKVFEVTDFSLVPYDGEDGPALGVGLTVRETDASVFDFNTSEEQDVDPSPNTNLIDPRAISTPTGLSLESGTTALVKNGSGDIVSRIRASWTAVAETNSTLAHYELQWKLTASAIWTDQVNIPAGVEIGFASPVIDDSSYDVRLRAVNRFGVASPYTTVAGHVVTGKTEAPAAPSGLITVGHINGIRLDWTGIADADLSHYEVWQSTVNNRNSGNRIANVKTDQFVRQIDPGVTRWYWVRAVDSSGNVSAFYPASATAGIQGTSGLVDTPDVIEDAITKGVSAFTAGSVSTVSNDNWKTIQEATITTIGQRVVIMGTWVSSQDDEQSVDLRLLRDGNVIINNFAFCHFTGVGDLAIDATLPHSWTFSHVPGAGVHHYEIQLRGSRPILVANRSLVLLEMKR